MFKYIRKAIPVVIVGVLFTSNAAFAAESNVSGGELQFSHDTNKTSLDVLSDIQTDTTVGSNIQFGAIGTINVNGEFIPKSVNDYIRIDDNRGTNQGWDVKVSATDLVATVPDKTSEIAGATVEVSIPIESVLTVQATNTINNAGSLTGITSKDEETSLTNSGFQILTAAEGTGAGSYTSDVTYKLSLTNLLPANTTLSPTDAESSFANLTDVSHIGLFAGDYSTTVQYSIVVAP